MQQDIFSDIPQDYNAKKDSIQDEIISNMYSKLTFLYLSPDSIRKHHLNDEENALNSPLFHFFENNKFITYEITEPSENLVKSKLFYDLDDPLYSYENFSQEVNVVICVEGKCLIIQSILKSIIFKIINKTRSTLINVSKNINNDFLIREIQGFYNDNPKSKNNHFFQLTFKPILTFFVRRYFYPSSYFKDTTFFTFDQKYRTFEIESKKSISDLLLLNDEKQFDDTSASLFTIKFLDAFKESCFEDDGQISIQKFTKSDFIFLRVIYTNTYYTFYLAIHIKSLYIFMVKKLNNAENTNIENEKYFCENIKHRCITRFYGFLYSDDSIDGFVYEYMSNGTLAECLLKSKIPVNGMFKFMTICRIFQGMNHLHSNSIIHRDLKPSNIFLDHDFIPYVSDFDATRYLYKGGDFTNDIGSNLYSSPEQDNGEIISPSTDIYSFGLIIYFLFEEKNFFNEQMDYQSIKEIKKSDIVTKLNAPLNFQEIFLGCVKNDKDKRMSNNEILKRIYDEVYSFGYLEHFLFKRFDLFYNQELVNYLYENFVFVYRYDQDITQLRRSFAYLFVYFHLKSIKEKDGFLDFIFHLACVYLKDKFIKHDELKAIDYFKLAASKGHFNSIAILETFGIFDFSTSKNKMKSVDYLISAANRKDSDALFQLGNLYTDGQTVPKNERKAIECYSEAAELGNLNACLLVGNYYINQMNYEKAIHYLKLAGDHGNSDALLNLGDIYNEGKGINVDHELAFKYFNLAASFNNPVALDRMGDLYANGLGVIQDKSRAIEYYESFLKFDYLGKFNNFNSGRLSQVRQHAEGLYSKFRAETFFKLGGIYLNDDGENFNIQKAIDCFISSAKLNNYKAQYILGEIYMNGHFGEIDYNKAKKFFEYSAQQNNSLAIFQLGNIYYRGLGVGNNYKENYQNALSYYISASKLGCSDAYIILGNLYLYGIIVEQNQEVGINYLRLAEKQGNPLAYAALGDLYLDGTIEKDVFKARLYYEKLACTNQSLGSQRLGYIYFNGIGVEKDEKKAIQYYELSARLGNSDAQFFLGSLYLSNYFDHPIYSKAISYLQYAAQNQNLNALVKLGKICYFGVGCEINYNLAKEYFEKAANKNNLESIYLLASMYQNGKGTKVDLKKAIEMYEKCIEIEDDRVEYFRLKEKSVIKPIRSSIYFYLSMNDLGLILITEPLVKDLNLGFKYIKEAGLNEFVHAKNNYGLILKYYNDNTDKARAIFEEASKKNFCLSDFNIGLLFEEKGQIDESVQFYIKASQHEDVPLMFRNHFIIDERLNISKTFIICLANLKLVVHFLNQSKNDDARQFFIRSLSKLINFAKGTLNQFHYNKKSGLNVFSYLRKFIIESPLFNLKNQPNLDFQKYIEKVQIVIDPVQPDNKEENEISDRVFSQLFNDKTQLSNKKFPSSDENEEEEEDHDGTIDDPGELFNFIIHDQNYSEQFVNKISELISIMNEILEKPPYLILFGRICINTEPQVAKTKQGKNINRLFYEGFGIELN